MIGVFVVKTQKVIAIPVMLSAAILVTACGGATPVKPVESINKVAKAKRASDNVAHKAKVKKAPPTNNKVVAKKAPPNKRVVTKKVSSNKRVVAKRVVPNRNRSVVANKRIAANNAATNKRIAANRLAAAKQQAAANRARALAEGKRAAAAQKVRYERERAEMEQRQKQARYLAEYNQKKQYYHQKWEQDQRRNLALAKARQYQQQRPQVNRSARTHQVNHQARARQFEYQAQARQAQARQRQEQVRQAHNQKAQARQARARQAHNRKAQARQAQARLQLASNTQRYFRPQHVDDPNMASRLSQAALRRTRSHVVYDGRYIPISYPNGDVPANMGVCTDVLIRSYRQLGIDLQRMVHEDMSMAFNAYPNLPKWGLSAPDPNIDHRRVHNLKVFFARNGRRLPVSNDPRAYQPGDLVTWDLRNGGQEHIGIVVDQPSPADPNRYMIVHNIGSGVKMEDILFTMPITGHYRYYPRMTNTYLASRR